MILRSAIIAVFCLPVLFSSAVSFSQAFDKAAFYAAFAGEGIAGIDAALEKLKESKLPEKEAFEGALLMKKAGLLSKPPEKLRTLKQGRNKLEPLIEKDPGNIEYRFLRLAIQENVPKITGYKKNIQEDSQLIKDNFKKLPAVVQQAIKDYSKKSKVLTSADL